VRSSAEKLTLNIYAHAWGRHDGESEIFVRQIAGCSTNVTVTLQGSSSPKPSLADKKTLKTFTYTKHFDQEKVAI